MSIHLVELSQRHVLAIDMLKQNFLSPEFGTKFQTEVLLFLEMPEFPLNTVQERWKEAPKQKPARFIQPFRQNTDL